MPFSVKIYRFISILIVPFTNFFLFLRVLRNKDDKSRKKERFGISKIQNNNNDIIWFHAASVGETLSILPIVKILSENESNILITTVTQTSSSIISKRFPKSVVHQYVPFDSPLYIKRFLSNWNPKIAIFIESEIWPNLIIETKKNKTAIILANARITKKSFGGWSRFPASIKYLLSLFDTTIAQDRKTLERLIELGSEKVKFFGNLKHDSEKLPFDSNKLKSLRESVGNKDILLASSTHKGEEEIIFSAYKELNNPERDLLLVIAPRHPERGKEIGKIADNFGFDESDIVFRSEGKLPKDNSKLYIYDTIGELGEIYEISEYVIMGGSFVTKGGHNPIEPAKFRTAIFSGPHYFNFENEYEGLIESKAAKIFKDKIDINILKDKSEIHKMALNAENYSISSGEVSDLIIKEIKMLMKKNA